MDRGKVIKGIQECDLNGGLIGNCPYKGILAMLKEQEAVEPKVEKGILDYQSWHYICGDCGGQIDINDNYCRHCGRVVAHLSNKI